MIIDDGHALTYMLSYVKMHCSADVLNDTNLMEFTLGINRGTSVFIQLDFYQIIDKLYS